MADEEKKDTPDKAPKGSAADKPQAGAQGGRGDDPGSGAKDHHEPTPAEKMPAPGGKFEVATGDPLEPKHEEKAAPQAVTPVIGPSASPSGSNDTFGTGGMPPPPEYVPPAPPEATPAVQEGVFGRFSEFGHEGKPAPSPEELVDPKAAEKEKAAAEEAATLAKVEQIPAPPAPGDAPISGGVTIAKPAEAEPHT